MSKIDFKYFNFLILEQNLVLSFPHAFGDNFYSKGINGLVQKSMNYTPNEKVSKKVQGVFRSSVRNVASRYRTPGFTSDIHRPLTSSRSCRSAIIAVP